MANKYCNLVGTNKIKDEYSKINAGFDGVETDINAVDSRVDNIVNNPDPNKDLELVDARQSTVKSKTFTTLDARLEEAEQDVATHKAENASKHIKESGSNENGSYIKYDDGTMICYYHEPTGTLNVTATPSNSFYHYLYTWTFPATFVGNVRCVGTADPRTAGGPSGIASVCGIGGPAPITTSHNIRIYSDVDFDRIFGLSLYAIGRWK